MAEGARLGVESLSFSLGGDATNLAIALTKMGYPAKLISGVGSDVVGECLMTALQTYGIDTSEVVRLSGQKKYATLIFRFPDRERTLFIDGREYLPFAPPLDCVRENDIVALCSLLQEPLLRPERAAAIAREARERGAIVCADSYTVRDLAGFEAYRCVFPYLDFYFPNDEEAARYTGCAEPEPACRRILDWGVKNVVMKLGARGCMLRGELGSVDLPAFNAGKVVDTTGCGDHFLAGFLGALLDGEAPRGCCLRASAVAAICTRYSGASTSVLERGEIDAIINGR